MAQQATASWGGGASPWGISWQKMMMWWFIVTDGLLFAGFLASYAFARQASPAWPKQADVFNMKLITLMTFILITSSATMATAVAAARNGDRRLTLRFLLLTVVGGMVFLGMQAYEWTLFIRHGATLTQNPWVPRAFSAYFFTITGFHGTHVLIGLIVLAAVAWQYSRDRCTADGIELAGLYWHFVDLVWVFVFGCFYLV